MRCIIPLVYNDPFRQCPEPGWYNNQVVYYLDLGPVILDPNKNKVADIYQFIYGFDKESNPIRVMGQWNVIDVVPGDVNYTPLWRIVYVIVPAGFIPQSIRSVQAIRACGFEIMPTETIVNCPVL